MVNGYVTLDLASKNIYKEALGAIKAGKPVMVVDDPDVYFVDKIDTATIDDEPVVVIKKNGKTIVIADNNAVSSTGVIYAPTMEEIRDLAGNKRFVEGVLTTSEIANINFTYAKWSLSGTHLMIVVAGNGTTGAILTGDVASVTLPKYIYDKILPTVSGSNLIDRKGMVFYGSGASQNTNMSLNKTTVGVSISAASLTLAENKEFKIQFDILIDAE